jgi:hypothetical protein
MLKLTLPNVAGFFDELVQHPRVVRVVALSGGYSREEANKHLASNKGVIASFSRALTEGLIGQAVRYRIRWLAELSNSRNLRRFQYLNQPLLATASKGVPRVK